MGRGYSVNGIATNTQSASLPLLTLMSTANIRPRVFEINVGPNAAPVDQTARMHVMRITDAGTPGSSITPQAIDPGDTSAALASAGLAIFSGAPTLTANSALLTIAVAQRSTFRWVPREGKEIVLPAAVNGIAFMALFTSSAWSMALGYSYNE